MIDFSRNHFELLGVPQRYRIDAAALERAYRDLQSDVHPDRHAAGTDADKRLALQASARVNEAYSVLRDPVARAEYLLLLRGVDASAETDSRLPVAFLTRQLERREDAEEAEDAHDERKLAALAAEVRDEAGELQGVVARALDAGELDTARTRVREMRFLAKLADDLDAMHGVLADR
jgi:molecular chaperone HscB